MNVAKAFVDVDAVAATRGYLADVPSLSSVTVVTLVEHSVEVLSVLNDDRSSSRSPATLWFV